MNRLVLGLIFLLVSFASSSSDAQIRPFAGNDALVALADAPDPLDAQRVIQQLDIVLQSDNDTDEEEFRLFEYSVARGDSLSSICRRNGIKLGTLYSLNPELKEGKLIKIGLRLLLTNVDGQRVIVRKGETVARVPSRYDEYGVTADDIYEANRLHEGAALRVGMKLFVPGAEMSPGEVQERTNWFFEAPVNAGRISSCFSHHRVLTVNGRRQARPHWGVDIALPRGREVRSSRRGRVTYAGWKGGYGKVVIIQHADGIETRYGHLSAVKVSTGQSVGQNQLIGNVGSTGNSTGPHLHLEYRVGGRPMNPLQYIRGFNISGRCS